MAMKKLTATDRESRSLEVMAENIQRLKSLFPELVSEGPAGAVVNVDVLKSLVGDAAVTDVEEKYGLNWHGKRLARQLALTPSTGTLRPHPEESMNWETTRNLMIEGDNLEVLKLLQKGYAGKVKLIYIDPPYNTGREFIYPDDFSRSIENYLMLTGQIDSDGRKITTNAESSGRHHTDWLSMMLPRLRLARSLLSHDGAIFISIDDCEVENLRKLCGEVFGEENFIATIIWQKVYSPKNSAKHFSDDHDYILVYARSADTWAPTLLPRSDEANARYENLDGDPRGPWKPSDLTARNYYSKGRYEVTSPSGKKFTSGVGRYWRQSIEGFKELELDDRIWWGPHGDAMPAQKRFLSEVQQGMVPQTMWFYKDVGHTQEAKKELLKHVNFKHNENVLNSVKPTRLIERILQIGTAPGKDHIVLDFFAGSAPTGHAVLKQNAKDDGDRRFILVQMHEPLPLPETDMGSIFDMGTQRMRAVSRSLQADHDATLLKKPLTDVGYRVFRLDSTNLRTWEPDANDIERTLLDSIELIKADRSAYDILYELLLKFGLDLCAPVEKRNIGGQDVYAVGGGVLLVCLAARIDRTDVEALAQGLIAWVRQLAPTADVTCVFRDGAFADDVAKSNMAATLEQHGIANVRSV